MENTELTLACSALARTCFDLANVSTVYIISGEDDDAFSITISSESLLLFDNSNDSEQETPE